MRNQIVLVVVGLMMWGAGAAKADHCSERIGGTFGV